MLRLEEGEKILLKLHHHWISILGPALFVFFLAIVPLFLIPVVVLSEIAELILPLFLFALSIWYLIVLILGFIFWMDFYLDTLIVTTERVLDMKQIGVFRYELSEFKLERVQNVTIEIPGFLATMLGYGDIIIETAGEISFTIKTVPHIAQAKNLILEHSKIGKV